MESTVSYIVLRREVVKSDWKIRMPKEKNNGRKVLVNEIFPKAEKPIQSPEWSPAPEGDLTPVLVSGYGGIEVATFNERACQDRHKHLISMEIYMVLEGEMTIRIEGIKVDLGAGDEVIILPGVVHEVLDNGKPFLTRLHSINCYGSRDKYTEENGAWVLRQPSL